MVQEKRTMPLADLLSSGLGKTWDWAKQNNLPQVAGSLLAAYALPAIAGSLVRKPYRGQVQAMLAQPLIGQAFDYLQRPQRMRDAMAQYQIQEQGLTPVPPTPDALPALTQNGMNLYHPQTLKQKFPDIFSAGQATSQSMRIAGDQPYRQQTIPALIELLQKQELQQQEVQRYQQGLQQIETAAQNNPDLIQELKIGPKGYVVPSLVQKKGTSSRPLVLPPGSIAVDPTTKQEVGRGLPKLPPKETLSDIKRRALLHYQKTGQVPPRFTEEQFLNWIEMSRDTELQDTASMMTLRDLNKEATTIKRDLAPFRALLKQYPEGNIPLAELKRAQDKIRGENPFFMDDDASSILAAQARLAEIEQETQQMLQPKGESQGRQQGAGSPASFSDFYQSLK